MDAASPLVWESAVLGQYGRRHMRDALATARTILLDDRRTVCMDVLTELAALPDEQVPALAALAHEVRLTWCGPTVEVEGILSAKTGGCPEDCHFCSQSAKFDTPVQATPFLDTEEVLLPVTRGARSFDYAIYLSRATRRCRPASAPPAAASP